MTTGDDDLKGAGTEPTDPLPQGLGAPEMNRPLSAEDHADQRRSEALQQAVEAASDTASIRDTAHIEANSTWLSGAPIGPGDGYAAFEPDFRDHHHTTRRYGPYEHYRLVYRYGYDLGVDTRYRCADWSEVEQAARPRWEQRNPGTWEEFKETIRYAWDKARGRC
jgi:hypothetical protein